MNLYKMRKKEKLVIFFFHLTHNHGGPSLKGTLFIKMTTKPIAAICQPRIYTNLENWNIDLHFNENS